MQLKIYSIRDSKGELYNTPFFQRTHGEAERAFRQLASDENSLVWKYPDDFDLYYIGELDNQTGVITPQSTPQHILKAAALPRPPLRQESNQEATSHVKNSMNGKHPN